MRETAADSCVARVLSLISDQTRHTDSYFFLLIITAAGFRDAEPLEPAVLFEFGELGLIVILFFF
jgi:hypothetical protein